MDLVTALNSTFSHNHASSRDKKWSHSPEIPSPPKSLVESVALSHIQDPSMSVDYPPDDLLEAFALYPAQGSPADIKVDSPETSLILHRSERSVDIGSPQQMDCDPKDSDVPPLDLEDKNLVENNSEMQTIHSSEPNIAPPEKTTPILNIPTPHQEHSGSDSLWHNILTQDPERLLDDSRVRAPIGAPSSFPPTVDRAIQTELHSQAHIERLIPLLPTIVSPASFLRAQYRDLEQQIYASDARIKNLICQRSDLKNTIQALRSLKEVRRFNLST